MKTPNVSSLVVVVLVLTFGVGVRAQEKPSPSRGKILILESERTLEGDIEKVGDQYCVRRSIGETWIPASKVLLLCSSKEEAFHFLASRTNLKDPDERLRLARWCHLQGLPRQALEQVREAVALRPTHAESKRLLDHLEQMAHAAVARPTPMGPPQPREHKSVELPLDVSAEALSLFATRVQPILMNTCLSCHCGDRNGAFKLERAYQVGLVGDRRVLQQNLTATLAQINPANPQLSPLLLKAVSAHGPTGQAPLKSREATAFRTLQDWVKLTVSSNPQLQERMNTRAAAILTTEASKFGADSGAVPPATPTPTTPALAPLATTEKPSPADRSSQPAPPEARPTSGTPKTPPTPVDEFDPLEFNQQAHPDRVSGPPAQAAVAPSQPTGVPPRR